MAHMATHNWLAVRTEPDAPKHKGISMMIVPMDAPGVTVQPIYVWPGLRTNALFLDNVRVPRDYLIGERGMGFYYAAMALNFERLSIGSVAMVRRYFRELVALVRELRGRRPAAARSSPGCASGWRAWRSTSRRRACSGWRPRGRSSRAACRRRESSMAKIFVSELAQRVADVGSRDPRPERPAASRGAARAAARPHAVAVSHRADARLRRRHQRGAAQHHRHARLRPAAEVRSDAPCS